MLRCAITEGSLSANSPASQRTRLLDDAQRWAASGIEFVQLREKNLEAGALFDLANAVRETLHANSSSTKLLINGRADVAVAALADGVHLTSRHAELTPGHVRTLFAHAKLPSPVVSISCHTLEDIARARDNGADLILFGPVFEKRVAGDLISTGVGLDALRAACQLAQPIPVLALGGITPDHTAACLAAGAAGVAGIRLFS